MAGLKSRVWNIEAHTFPEVFFEDDWHVLDPDAEVWYPRDDELKSLKSMREVEADPDAALLPVRMSDWYQSRKQVLIDAFREPKRQT